MLLDPAPGVDLDLIRQTFGRPCSIRGVEKDDRDLDRYSVIIAATQPEVLVECGARHGYSADWFATLVPAVVSIDINSDLLHIKPAANVLRFTGSSVDPQLVRDVASLVAGRRVMVSLDSDHSRAHVIREIQLWAEHVTPGCYLVIEDGIYHWINSHEYDGDPLEAISAEMPLRPEFRRDLDTEGAYPITGAIAGWWQRLRQP